MRTKNNRYFATILLIGFLLHPSLLGSKEDVFTNPTVRKQLIQFILETTKPKTSTFWGTFRFVAGKALFSLATPVIFHLIQTKKKTVVIEEAIQSTNIWLPRIPNIRTTQDINQFTAVVSQDMFTFESVLLYAEQSYLGFDFAAQLANNIGATIYSFSAIESTIKKRVQELQSYYQLAQKTAKFGIADTELNEVFLGITAISQEELLVHLLKKVETRKEHPPHKVIIFFDTLRLTKIKNFKSLINPSNLAKDSRYNNFIFITATSDNEVKGYGRTVQAQLDRFDRKIQIIEKQE